MCDKPITSDVKCLKNPRENLSNGISPFDKLFDIQHQSSHLNLLFDVIVNRIQSTYHHQSQDVHSMKLNEVDKNILINSLPEIEEFFLEKIRLCWFNFTTRFQSQIANGNPVDKSFILTTIVNVEKKLLSFDSMFNNVDYNSSTSNNTVKPLRDQCKKNARFQLNNRMMANEPKVLYNRISLLQTQV